MNDLESEKKIIFGSLDWDSYRKLYESISPVEENVIRRQFIQMIEGNECEGLERAKMIIADQYFRFGWVAARLSTAPVGINKTSK